MRTQAVAVLFVATGLLGMGILHTVMELLNQGHSREQELEADRLATQIIHYAGFDTAGGTRLLQRLGAIPSERWLGSTYFSSHPPMEAPPMIALGQSTASITAARSSAKSSIV